MNRPSRSNAVLAPLALAAALAVLPVPAARADHDDHVEARELLRRGEILPLSRILERVAQRVPGDVIEVELERDDGAWEYDVKVLTPTGQVRKVEVDARNGTVLKVKDD